MATQLQESEDVESLNVQNDPDEIESQSPDEGDVDHSEDTARALGWKPKDEYKGDPAQWRDWQDFLDMEAKNGPQIRAQNKVLTRKIVALEKRLAKSEAVFAEAKEYFSKAEEMAYNRAVADIRKRQRAAVETGDTDAYDEADQELKDLDSEVKARAAPKKPEIDPGLVRSFRKWERDNDWYGSDKVMTAAADAIAAELGSVEENGLDVDDWLDEWTARIKKEFPHKFKSAESLPKKRSAVEGVGESRGARNAETFENLPLEARQQYQRFVDMDVPVKKETFTKNAWEKIRKEARR